ncbi:MAG: nucleoside-diphosphate sugar epimerase [Novosphingobium pentaromativorans]|uniref:Nucleoside-diphosphate sugar epimerase n=1 Tax=Novosphingobium pentaromativorans TaxID=205844 RepID=A0A2W5NSP5_9SPHN|nr:MAG: nucleoside-diphosphate sugar epimerase [Novosphingobium pentaromativorans]
MYEAPVQVAGAAARRLCLVGASGLVGSAVIEESRGRPDVRVIGVARREVPLPQGARLEILVGATSDWPELIAAAHGDVLVCALGTTRKAAGSDAAFRAVDHDLVLEVAAAARKAGIGHMILVSSVGADPASSNLYLRTKGETEDALGKLGFARLDILRPGLLRGRREEGRPLEMAGQMVAPLADLLVFHARLRRFRSIASVRLAQVILSLGKEDAPGRFVHEHDSFAEILRDYRS